MFYLHLLCIAYNHHINQLLLPLLYPCEKTAIFRNENYYQNQLHSITPPHPHPPLSS